MVGSLLFRNTLQELKRLHIGKIPWDEEIVSEELKKSWFDYFEMLLGLDQIKFNRCVKPIGAIGDPSVITFSDDNPDSYGTVAYVLWTLTDGRKVANLVMSKVKLGPLLQKGEMVRMSYLELLLQADFKCSFLRILDWILMATFLFWTPYSASYD